MMETEGTQPPSNGLASLRHGGEILDEGHFYPAKNMPQPAH